ncbi:MAG TPA: PLP-dependent aminotransferase family protein [Telmatospirillum sp.]|nr:PLP-dependent aminotransferase family protein [Telmatospirillum sp.]
MVDSGTQAIDLINRLLIQPNDTVFVDDPCYFNYLCNLRAHRAKVVGIPFRPNGPDLEIFAAEAARHRPRLYITNAALHNPTGASLSPAVAHRLLKLAEDFGITIVEDDIFVDFEEQPTPRLAALDQLNRVIYVGSFSKTLSSAMRCGYIGARPDLIEGLIDLKLATMMSSNEVSAQVMHRLLTDGSYRKHVEALRGRLRAAGVPVRRALAETGLTLWTDPQGGLFLWAMLPEGLDSAIIAKRALAQGVSLAPGNAFSVTQSASRFFRFNVAQARPQRVYEVLRGVMAER